MNKPTTLIFLTALMAYAFSASAASANASASAPSLPAPSSANANAHAAASAVAIATHALPETDVKCGAGVKSPASSSVAVAETDSKEGGANRMLVVYSHFKPQKEAVRESIACAEQATTPLAILSELCKPYEHGDPDECAWPVFQEWKRICESKNLMKQAKTRKVFDAEQLGKEIDAMGESYARNPLMRCVVGIAGSYEEAHNNAIHYGQRGCRRVWEAMYAYSVFEDVVPAHTVDRTEILERASALLDELRIFPKELIYLLIQYVYYNSIGYTVAESLTRKPLTIATDGTGYLVNRWIRDLAGLDRVACDKVLLSSSLIHSLGVGDFLPNQFMSIRITSRLRSIAPYTFARQSRLMTLDLSSNLLAAISKDSLVGLDQLQDLDLSHNEIRRIEPGAFAHLRNLMRLCLSSNHLTEVPADIEQLVRNGNLATFAMEDNPLTSDEQKRYEALRARVYKNSGSYAVKVAPPFDNF